MGDCKGLDEEGKETETEDENISKLGNEKIQTFGVLVNGVNDMYLI